MPRLRIAVLTPLLTPYRIALFNEIATSGECDLLALTMAESKRTHGWRIDETKLRFSHATIPTFTSLAPPRYSPLRMGGASRDAINRIDPNVVVVSGYDQVPYWQMMFRYQRRGSRCLLWSGTTEMSAGVNRGIRRALKQVMVRRADAFIAYGTLSKQYLEDLGAPLGRVTVSTNTVDMDYFREESDKRRNDPNYLEQRSRFPTFLLLYVGQLIARKGIALLLKALRTLDDPNIGLLIVGDGPLGGHLKATMDSVLRQKVFFESFQQVDTLPRFYALADALVLPSLVEPWGLVVNEALATGLYSLVSTRAGAGHDLIRSGWNGELFDPLDTDTLCHSIRRAKKNLTELRARRAKIAREACDAFSIRASADAFLAALEQSFEAQSKEST